MTNEIGQVIQRFQYAPYGELVSGDSSVTPFLFNGMYGVTTDESGLYYMRARFYSPEIKRFVNQDVLLGNIVEGQTLNRFAFVTGNPIGYVDPEGELGILAGALIGISIWAISEIVLPTLFPPDIEEGSGEVIPSALPDIVSGVVVATRALAKGTCQVASSLWKSRSPGIQVRQFGNWWVKRVNPNAGLLMQRWGSLTIEAQTKTLRQLGHLGAEFQMRSGKLFIRDVGETSSIRDKEFWKAFAKGSWRLKTLFHDIKPRNVGKKSNRLCYCYWGRRR